MLTTEGAKMDHPPPAPCLESEELAAFMDGRLEPAARERVLAHLDTCADCYELLAACARPLELPAPARGWWRQHWVPLAGLAAAAGLTAFLILNPAPSPDRPALPLPTGAEARQAPPAALPQPVADDPAGRLMASAAPSSLLPFASTEEPDSFALAPTAESDRRNALLAGVYQTDLEVATRAGAVRRVADLRRRLDLLDASRRGHPQSFALGRLVEASRLAALSKTAAFFADGSVRERLGAASVDEPNPARQKALRRVVQLLGQAPAPPSWAGVAAGLDDVLGP